MDTSELRIILQSKQCMRMAYQPLPSTAMAIIFAE